MSSLQWRPGRSETSGCPSPSIAGPWEASSEASVREANNGGGLLQVSKLTPGPRSFAPEPSTLLTLAGGALGALSTRLMHPWVTSGVGAGDSIAPAPTNTLLCVGAVGQNW